MNKKVKNLTPAILKRIIAEESSKIKNAARKKRKPRKTNKQLIESYLKCLKLLKEARAKNNRDLKNIERARSIIKSKLVKRL